MRKKIGEQEAVMQAFRRSMEEDDFQDMMPKEADPTPLPECPVSWLPSPSPLGPGVHGANDGPHLPVWKGTSRLWGL